MPEPKPMSDAAVHKATGKTLADWFTILDAASASTLEHKAIASILFEKHGVPGWWCQMVTVEYERARGLRQAHEKAHGYSVSASKTIAVPLSPVYQAWADHKQRAQWLDAAVDVSTTTKNKYFRGSLAGGAKLEVGFYEKPGGKTQVATQVNKLASAAEVETQRTFWKEALAKLEAYLDRS